MQVGVEGNGDQAIPSGPLRSILHRFGRPAPRERHNRDRNCRDRNLIALIAWSTVAACNVGVLLAKSAAGESIPSEPDAGNAAEGKR